MPFKDPERQREANRATASRWRADNREKAKENSRAWKTANPERVAAHARKARYGISQEQYDEMVMRQRGLCAICGHADPKRALSVDHNHATGRVRALLCNACNRGIGLLEDNADRLEAAAAYLKEHDGS